MANAAAHVHSLHRYPVKSLVGETVPALDFDVRGGVGDRVWSIRTAGNKIGSGKNTRRFAAVPRLLLLRATTHDDRIKITMPDGEAFFADEPSAALAISRYVGQPVTLARETNVSHFDDGPVSLLGRESVAMLSAEVGQDIDPARFRPNIVLAGLSPLAEDELLGQRIRVGGVVLQVTLRSTRCVMVDMETAELPAQPGNLRAAGRVNQACLGLIAQVLEPGRVFIGDRVEAG